MNNKSSLNFNVTAVIGNDNLSDQDIKNLELARAQRCLEILKTKLGHDKLKELFQDEMNEVTTLSEKWVEESNGEWKSDFVIMHMPKISAKEFLTYFEAMASSGKEELLRFAHPDHIINTLSASGDIEVIENIGEYEYPWHIFLKLVPFDKSMPLTVDNNYPHGFVAPAKSINGKIIMYAGHEFRDLDNGMGVKLSIAVPKTAPDHLLVGHLRHFSVEFRNWYYAAVSELAAKA